MMVRRIPIRNVSVGSLTVHVEPWGDQHVLLQDEQLEVVFYGPDGGKPEINIGDSAVFVYGWHECRVFVLKDNLCLSQPSLLAIIDRLCASHGIDKSKLELELEIINYVQTQLDAGNRWDKAGREAAFTAVAKVAPLFSDLDNETFVWMFCQTVLQLRGVFLLESKSKQDVFFDVLRASGDLHGVLAQWYQSSSAHDEIADAGVSV